MRFTTLFSSNYRLFDGGLGDKALFVLSVFPSIGTWVDLYVYVCVCICVCVWLGVFHHGSLWELFSRNMKVILFELEFRRFNLFTEPPPWINIFLLTAKDWTENDLSPCPYALVCVCVCVNIYIIYIYMAYRIAHMDHFNEGRMSLVWGSMLGCTLSVTMHSSLILLILAFHME